jgi:hypothetical protein
MAMKRCLAYVLHTLSRRRSFLLFIRGVAMKGFVIVEIADGLEVVELKPNQTPEDAAFAINGFLADEEIYPSFEQAKDALADIAVEDEREQE